jgi:hypothetical protein
MNSPRADDGSHGIFFQVYYYRTTTRDGVAATQLSRRTPAPRDRVV